VSQVRSFPHAPTPVPTVVVVQAAKKTFGHMTLIAAALTLHAVKSMSSRHAKNATYLPKLQNLPGAQPLEPTLNHLKFVECCVQCN
jgi:hypothetical protein